MPLINQRTLVDASLSASVALPAAAASATTAAIDLVTITPGRVPEVELRIFTSGALPSLANSHTATFTVLGSTDNNSDFTAIADLPVYTLTGAGGVGSAALFAQVKLPISLPRYIQLQITVASGGGSNIAVTATIELVF